MMSGRAVPKGSLSKRHRDERDHGGVRESAFVSTVNEESDFRVG
ncbi:hypothetical protein [Peribacillus simplex]|nr:hypothetical protein [Peribacillus simplex]